MFPKPRTLLFFSKLKSNRLGLLIFFIAAFSPSLYFFAGIYRDSDQRKLWIFHSERFNTEISSVYVELFFNIFGNIFHIFHCTNNEVIHKGLSKCDQINRKLQIWSQLLKKSLMENFIFCAVFLRTFVSYP